MDRERQGLERYGREGCRLGHRLRLGGRRCLPLARRVAARGGGQRGTGGRVARRRRSHGLVLEDEAAALPGLELAEHLANLLGDQALEVRPREHSMRDQDLAQQPLALLLGLHSGCLANGDRVAQSGGDEQVAQALRAGSAGGDRPAADELDARPRRAAGEAEGAVSGAGFEADQDLAQRVLLELA